MTLLNITMTLLGQKIVLVSVFFYWNLIDDILRVCNHHQDIQNLIKEAEKTLKELVINKVEHRKCKIYRNEGYLNQLLQTT